MSKASFTRRLLLVTGLLGLAGCTISQTETPDLFGPSEFALSFNLVATPDTINQDGGSQSRIVLTALDPNGQPRVGVTFRLDQTVDGQIADFGTLSTKTLVTDSNGRATVTYTAPAAPPSGSSVPICRVFGFQVNLPGHCVSILATPVGTNYITGVTQSVDIRLIPLGTIVLPGASGGSTPTASFTFSPAAPTVGAEIIFDAGRSTAGTGHRLVNYKWEWGDNLGDPPERNNPLEDHDYPTAGPYRVTLTVTDEIGQASNTVQTVTVK